MLEANTDHPVNRHPTSSYAPSVRMAAAFLNEMRQHAGDAPKTRPASMVRAHHAPVSVVMNKHVKIRILLQSDCL